MTIKLKQFTQVPNVGDKVSSLIASYICEEDVTIIDEAPSYEANLIAIGSILHWADANSVVWGTGFISDQMGLRTAPKAVLAVRGHLTRQRLEQHGVRCPAVVGDPGVFVSELFPAAKQTVSLGVIPHYVDCNDQFVLRAREFGAKILDVFSPLEDFFSKLSSCGKIISSSLHGLIFAHAYGIPAVWVKLSPGVIGDGFKFLDYYSSIGIRPRDVRVFGRGDALEVIAGACEPAPVAIDKAALRQVLRESLPALRVRTSQPADAGGGLDR